MVNGEDKNWVEKLEMVCLGKDVRWNTQQQRQAWKEQEYASLGLRMKFKTLFMSDEEKHRHNFYSQLLFNMSKQLLAPRGLSAECVMGPSGNWLWGPQGLWSSNCSKLVFVFKCYCRNNSIKGVPKEWT